MPNGSISYPVTSLRTGSKIVEWAIITAGIPLTIALGSWATAGRRRVAVRRFDGTMHLVCNHYSEVDGERAVAESYGLAYHWGSPREDIRRNFVSTFRYVDRLERREGEWRIAARAAVREWTRALDPADWIPPEGKAPEGSRDAEDPIYRAGAVRLDRRP